MSVSHLWALLSSVWDACDELKIVLRERFLMWRRWTSALLPSHLSQQLACHMRAVTKQILRSRLEEHRGIMNLWWGSMSSITSLTLMEVCIWSLYGLIITADECSCMWFVHCKHNKLLQFFSLRSSFRIYCALKIISHIEYFPTEEFHSLLTSESETFITYLFECHESLSCPPHISP